MHWKKGREGEETTLVTKLLEKVRVCFSAKERKRRWPPPGKEKGTHLNFPLGHCLLQFSPGWGCTRQLQWKETWSIKVCKQGWLHPTSKSRLNKIPSPWLHYLECLLKTCPSMTISFTQPVRQWQGPLEPWTVGFQCNPFQHVVGTQLVKLTQTILAFKTSMQSCTVNKSRPLWVGIMCCGFSQTRPSRYVKAKQNQLRLVIRWETTKKSQCCIYNGELNSHPGRRQYQATFYSMVKKTRDVSGFKLISKEAFIFIQLFRHASPVSTPRPH